MAASGRSQKLEEWMAASDERPAQPAPASEKRQPPARPLDEAEFFAHVESLLHDMEPDVQFSPAQRAKLEAIFSRLAARAGKKQPA
jgi:tRNA C32,U32 (ribose-2'-O)-methylase TrmJ